MLRHLAAAVWSVVEGIGGDNGWSFPLAWEIRGWMDRAVGELAPPRRRDLHHLMVGEAVDFWRVEELVPKPCCVGGRDEARVLPGWSSPSRAMMTIGSSLASAPRSYPRGLAGHAYWYAWSCRSTASSWFDDSQYRGCSRSGARPTAAR